jgi:hypothetical protein
MITASAFQDGVASVLCDRRQFQRLHVAVQTELRVQGNEMPIRVETADISMCGCYVEMAVTLDVGTALNIILWLGHEKLAIAGRVASNSTPCRKIHGRGCNSSSMPTAQPQRTVRRSVWRVPYLYDDTCD